jgi:hypothetical protein
MGTNTNKKRYYNGATPFRADREITYGGQTHHVKNMIMHNDEFKTLLGCNPKRHWPAEGAGPKRICGVMVICLPKGQTMRKGKVVPAKSPMARRLWAECPNCKGMFCAGHMGQHMSACVGE